MAKQSPYLPKLESVALRGDGKHIWDLGDVSRPGPCGEWYAVKEWLQLVGGEIVPALQTGLGVERVAWTGVVQLPDRKFEIIARTEGVQQKRDAPMEACSWDDVVRLTAARERDGHPAFKLFN